MKTAVKQLNKKTVKVQPVMEDGNVKHKPFVFALKIFIVVIVIGALIAVPWGIARANEGKIYPRVTIAGIKVGGLTPTEAKKIVDNYVTQINAQGPTIILAGVDQKLTPKLSELGVTFDSQEVVDEAYNFGRAGTLVDRVKENATLIAKTHDIPLLSSINEKTLDTYLSQTATVVELASQDATLKYENGTFVIQNSQNGRGLNKNRLKNAINSFIQTGQNQGTITLETTVLEPVIKETGALAAKPEADKMLAAAPITIEFADENKNFTAGGSEVASWIDFTVDGSNLKPVISDKKLADYVAYIASKIEIDKVDKEVVDGTGEVKNAGVDGRGVNKGNLTTEIKTRVLAGSAGSSIAVVAIVIPKGLVTIYPSAKPGRYAGRYIDVNLSEQTLYAYEGTQLVNKFLISSGIRSHPTPLGEFSVYNKTRSQLMDGPDYYLPNVPWISWFSGDYSIHGTYWHSNFGHPMSHGCINASIADAEWIYNWDEVGTPVYVHD